MKKISRGLVAAICVLVMGLVCGKGASMGADSKDSEQAIKKVLEQFVGSMEKRDAAGIKNILHTSVIFVEASGNNSHVELADQKKPESLLPPKGNDDWQGIEISDLSINISATHPSVAVVSFLMKFKLSNEERKSMEGALAQPQGQFTEEQRKEIEKVLKDGCHGATMFALMAMNDGHWKIVSMTFPK